MTVPVGTFHAGDVIRHQLYPNCLFKIRQVKSIDDVIYAVQVDVLEASQEFIIRRGTTKVCNFMSIINLRKEHVKPVYSDPDWV